MIFFKKLVLCLALLFQAAAPVGAQDIKGKERHFLYVALPGIRNYLEYGGAGLLVFDMDKNHAFVKRIPTPASQVQKPENIKGVCACGATRRLYFTTLSKLYCLDLVTEKTLWEKTLPGGCDRMAITPDGKTLFVPSFEKDHWNVVDGDTGGRAAPRRRVVRRLQCPRCQPHVRHAAAADLPSRRPDQRLSVLNRHQCIPGDAGGGG